jgi:hypothetical protein
MALLSLARDAVPSWAKIDLHLHHQSRRAWFGLGRLRCEWCSEKWGRYGCHYRERAARVFVHTATAAQQREAMNAGRITREDLHLRRRVRTGAHRRRPRPYPTTPGPLAECLAIAEALA